MTATIIIVINYRLYKDTNYKFVHYTKLLTSKVCPKNQRWDT